MGAPADPSSIAVKITAINRLGSRMGFTRLRRNEPIPPRDFFGVMSASAIGRLSALAYGWAYRKLVQLADHLYAAALHRSLSTSRKRSYHAPGLGAMRGGTSVLSRETSGERVT